MTNTNGVKQQLWGLQLSSRAAPGAAVTSEDGSEPLGRLTSYANLEKDGHFGLAYIKCRRQGVQVSQTNLSSLRIEPGAGYAFSAVRFASTERCGVRAARQQCRTLMCDS